MPQFTSGNIMQKNFQSRKGNKVGYVFKTINTPVGRLKLIANNGGLVAILWSNDNPNRVKITAHLDQSHPVLLKAEQQLQEYFSEKRKSFSLKLNPIGTDFQKKVWQALLTIPYGETKSYLELAQQIGNAKACRAVGAANGKNPISIIIPCHRVIGTNGKLTGFAGGLETKAQLLSLEGNLL